MSFRKPSEMLHRSWAAAIAGSVALTTLGVGAYQKGRANKKIKKALSERKPYSTPDEVYQMLNATENKAQGDTAARDFQTNQLDTSFSQALGADVLLGAGPNALSDLFGQKIQGLLQVGNQFHASNMEAFGNYMKSLNIVAENKAAEQGSVDNIWKDAMQSYAQQKADANATMNSGINGLVGAASMYGTNKLYGNNNRGGSYATSAEINAVNNPRQGFDQRGFNEHGGNIGNWNGTSFVKNG